jgi:tyrosine-protein kinase Etk/Wzc
MLFFFRTLIQSRKFVLLSGFVGALLLAVLSLVLPSWYTATTTVFPPETPTTMMPFAGLMQQFSAPILGPLGVAPGTIYIEMLKSRTVCVKIIEEFDLMKRYKAERIEEAVDALHSHLGFTLLDNGMLVLTVEDRDPQRAADIANRMVELLDETTRTIKETRAGRTREFIQRQLTERELMLAASEDSLKRFQQKYNTVNLDEQLAAAMDIVTALTSRAITLETEMGYMKNWVSPNSEEYQRKQAEYNEVMGQLRKLKANKKGTNDEDVLRSFFPTLHDVPDVALQYLRLRREVEIQNTVYTMLTNEYEKARIEEARDTPVVQVLDTADRPNLRSRPKRKIFTIVGGILGLGWGTMAALFRSAWREKAAHATTVHELTRPIAADFARLRRRRERP